MADKLKSVQHAYEANRTGKFQNTFLPVHCFYRAPQGVLPVSNTQKQPSDLPLVPGVSPSISLKVFMPILQDIQNYKMKNKAQISEQFLMSLSI